MCEDVGERRGGRNADTHRRERLPQLRLQLRLHGAVKAAAGRARAKQPGARRGGRDPASQMPKHERSAAQEERPESAASARPYSCTVALSPSPSRESSCLPSHEVSRDTARNGQ